MRTLGGTGRKARKRNSRDVKREDPMTQEWVDSMSKPGGEGGCMATEVDRYAPGEHRDRREVLSVAGVEGMEVPLKHFDGQQVLEVFEAMKYMRAVPKGRAAKELYQMAMAADPGWRAIVGCLFNMSYRQSKTC